MRSRASAGLARTCSCRWARAAAGSPPLRLCSAASAEVIGMCSKTCVIVDAEPAASGRFTPLIFERGAALRHAVAALRCVFDGNLVERETHARAQRGGAALIARFDIERHHPAILNRDLQILDLRRAGL